MSKNKKGFTLIQIILSILAGTVILGGTIVGTFYFSKSPELSRGIACTQEAKICPDGTAVGRIGPNCEFAVCRPTKQPSQSRCGDGVCDMAEKANPNLCPKDCTGTEKPVSGTTPLPLTPKTENTVTVKSSSAESPFGINPANANNYSFGKDLGVKWSRDGLYLRWSWVDINRDGGYKFTTATAPPKPNVPNSGGKINYDTAWLNTPKDIELVVNICPFGMGGDFKNSEEPAIYQNFVEKTVERYDGDDDFGCSLASPDCYKKGDGQYPTSEVIQVFKNNPIKYWQVCNHVYDASEKGKTTNYASQFAVVQEKTYKGVKVADSGALVLIAGDSNKELYPAVFEKLNGNYIDIVDFHRFGKFDWYNPKKDFDYLKASLQSSGFNMNKLRFWITETGTYSGDPVAIGIMPDLPYQTEKQQAIGLLKMYASSISYGIEEVFWAWNIVEGFQKDGSIFDYTGLVYDGCDYANGKYTCGDNVGYDKGKDVKKLSYYTYKKMVEVLDGSDWNNIQIIQEKDGVYIYKFTKNNKPIWVVWNDNSGNKQVTISDITSSSVKVTEAIPKYESGKEVTDYSTAFSTETKTVSGGKVTITLKDKPVFVETSQVATLKTTTSVTPPTTKIENTVSTKSSSKDSPFGIYSPYGELTIDKGIGDFTTRNDIANYLKDIGIKWAQELPLTSFDDIPQEINLYSRLGREGGMKSDKIYDSTTVERYKSELKKSISKYKDRIKYWEVDTEPDGVGGWRNNPEGYVELLKISSEVVKKECPDCKIIFGGLSGGASALDNQAAPFLENVLKAGGADYFDGMEFKRHHTPVKDYKLIKNKFDSIGAILSKYNVDIKKIPVFVETAMYDGDPNYPVANVLEKNNPKQTESEQAVGLAKTYVYGLSVGIDKIFWNLIYERKDYESGHQQPFPQNPFNGYGLIHTPKNGDGLSHKKLSYYTYKKMVEVLDGSDWSNIQTIQEKDGVYIYKFTKNNKPIWVAWNDNAESKSVTISGITSSSVKVTKAIPKYESGKEVTNYSTAFSAETKTVSGGRIMVTLKDIPVFVE